MKKIISALLLLPALAFAQYSGPIYTPSNVAITGGTITGTTVSKVTVTAPATSATLTIANGKTLTANKTLTLDGTDSTTMTFPATSATIARTDAANTFTGTQAFGALTATTVNGNTITTGSSTFTGTAAQTYTFPTTSATIARTDAANTFTGTQTISTLVATTFNGNTITAGSSVFTGTAAQTYTFPATTSTLADISTGAWTPTDGSGASITFTNAAGTYVKIGKLVFLSARVTYPVTASGLQAVINIPYTAGVAGNAQYNAVGGVVTSGTAVKCQVDRGTTLLYFYGAGNTGATNAGQSTLVVDFSIVYQTP